MIHIPVLRWGEPYKSLASFARTVPAIHEASQSEH